MNENKTYYFTFATSHFLGDHWIEISAPNAEMARLTITHFSTQWAFQYQETDFKPEHFPGGRVGRVLEVI